MPPVKTLLRAFNEYKYGIALGGGGIKGFAHIGVLKALNEAGIYPEVISGVSAGAIVGAFYADGYKPDEIFNIIYDNNFFKFVNFTFPKQGLLKTSGLEKTLIKYLRARKFEDLKMPLYIGATELNSGRLKYFSEGKLIKSILASSCMPILFIPVTINDKTYVDGGVLENLPITPISGKCRRLIGVHLSPRKIENNFSNLIHIADRLFSIYALRAVEMNKKKCNIVIEPPELKDFGLLELSKGKDAYNIGYEYTKTLIKQLPPLQRIPNNPLAKRK